MTDKQRGKKSQRAVAVKVGVVKRQSSRRVSGPGHQESSRKPLAAEEQ